MEARENFTNQFGRGSIEEPLIKKDVNRTTPITVDGSTELELSIDFRIKLMQVDMGLSIYE